MSEDPKDNKREIDADQMIRQYEETAYTEEPEEAQTEIPWYEQAKQDTSVPAEAVLTGWRLHSDAGPGHRRRNRACGRREL
jgi:hypothetical protein